MENSEVLIEVNGVSKKFCRDFKKSLKYGMLDVIKAFFGINLKSKELRNEEFWAVKNIDFTLKRGECLGVIGHNGAGKSTLLKILNGLIRPDEGEIRIHGKIGALIELGAGFNPILSGRENVYINGQILGFTKKEIDDKMEAIIEFSEIGKFIDSPVQNYSSGMKVRLGFAVAAHMNPDILIIDEVLAVGDINFRTKCFNKINELIDDTAVIFVSHSMPQVYKVATKILLMQGGQASYYGHNLGVGIEKYYEMSENEKSKIVGEGIQKIELIVNNISIKVGDEFELNYCDNLKLEINNLSVDLNKVNKLVCRFIDKSLINVATAQSKVAIKNQGMGIDIPKTQFGAGKYGVNLFFINEDQNGREHILAYITSAFVINSINSRIENHSATQYITNDINN